MKSKHIQLLLLGAALFFTGTACQKEIGDFQSDGQALELSMIPELESMDTKTYLGESAGMPAIYWGTGEYITLWYNDGADRFARSADATANTNNNKMNGSFTFSISPAQSSSYRLGGYYPSSAVKEPKGSRVLMTLPAEQTATSSSYDPAAFLLVARPGTDTSFPNPLHLTFRRAVALNELTLTNVPESIKAVTITADNCRLAGGRYINLSTGASEDSWEGESAQIKVNFSQAQAAGTVKVYFTSWGATIPQNALLKIRVDCPSGTWYKCAVKAGTGGIAFKENAYNKLSANLNGAIPRPTVAEAFAEAYAGQLDVWANTSGSIIDLAGNNPASGAASSTGHYVPHDITITANGKTYTKGQAFFVASKLLQSLWEGKTFFNATLSSTRRSTWPQQSFLESNTFTATTVKADLLTTEDSGYLDRQLEYRDNNRGVFANYCSASANPAAYTNIGDCSIERINLILARVFRYLLDKEITSDIAGALSNVPISTDCFGTGVGPVDPPVTGSSLKSFAQEFVKCLDVWQNTIGEVDADGAHFNTTAWTNVHLIPVDPATMNSPGYSREGNQHDSKYAPFWSVSLDGNTYTSSQCWEIAIRGILDMITLEGASALQNHTGPNVSTFTAGNGKSFSTATTSSAASGLKWGAYPWYEQDEPVTLGGAAVSTVGVPFLLKVLPWHYVRAIVSNSGNTPLGCIGNFQYFSSADDKLQLTENGQMYSGYICPMRELLLMARFYKYLLDNNLDSNIYSATQNVRFNYALYVAGISLSQTSLSFTASGGSKGITLNADDSWTASSSASWIQVSPASGAEGDGQSITIQVGETSGSARTGTVTFSCPNGSVVLTVKQQGDEIDDETILAMVRTDVLNTAYYKDLFLDGGCELNPGIKENGSVINGRLPYAMAKSGITNAEYFLSTVNNVDNGYTSSDKTLQTNIISGTSTDLNGVLLYPDGEPRFRLIYVFGGHSGPHGTTLGATGRSRVKTFYDNGGSYVGSCAGAYLAGRYASGSALNYFNIWTNGNMKSTGVSNSSIEIKMVTNTFASLYGPANGVTITGTRHNGGGYMDVNGAPAGTEIIARFLNQTGKTSTSAGFYNQPGVWAYKASANSGRLVVTGSHPEDAASGDILNLTASMFKYAWNGSGIAKVKGVLHNGETRAMTKGTSDAQPAYTAIGDLQCHHFVFYLPKAVSSLNLNLAGSGSYNLELYLKPGDFAFPENSPAYTAKASGSSQTITTGALSAGLWYVTVRCATTVTSTEVITDKTNNLGRSFTYSGKTGVLNGVPYSITASWTE